MLEAAEVREWLKVITPVAALAASLWIASSQSRRAQQQRDSDRRAIRQAALAFGTDAMRLVEEVTSVYLNPEVDPIAKSTDLLPGLVIAAANLEQFTVKELPDAEAIKALRSLATNVSFAGTLRTHLQSRGIKNESVLASVTRNRADAEASFRALTRALGNG